MSGLAEGIDTAAHTAAINRGGRTIAVLGTPLDQVFPRQNAALQDQIMRDHLAVSQFPAGNPIQRKNFPLRNRTMALISDATGHDHNGKYHGHPPMARPARSRAGTRMHLPGCTRSRVPTGPGRCDSSPGWQSPQVNAIPTAARAPRPTSPILPRQVRSASDLEPHAGRSGWCLAHLSCRGNNARDLADPDLRRRRSVIRRIPARRYRVRGGNRIARLVYGAKWAQQAHNRPSHPLVRHLIRLSTRCQGSPHMPVMSRVHLVSATEA